MVSAFELAHVISHTRRRRRRNRARHPRPHRHLLLGAGLHGLGEWAAGVSAGLCAWVHIALYLPGSPCRPTMPRAAVMARAGCGRWPMRTSMGCGWFGSPLVTGKESDMTEIPIREDLPPWHELNDPLSQNGPCDRAPEYGQSHAMHATGTDAYRCSSCLRVWSGQTCDSTLTRWRGWAKPRKDRRR